MRLFSLVLSAFLVIASCAHAGAAVGSVTATKDDGVPAATRKAAGSTVTYTNTITNGTAADVTGVQFLDPDVAHAGYVALSLKATPVALNDTYPATVIANTSINTATSGFSVITNDFGGFSGGVAVANTALTISAFDVASTGGGTVSMITTGAGVGQFTYTPAAGFTGTDTFTYTISNGVAGGTPVSVKATVSIAVGGPVVWFVDPNSGTNGNGTLGSPFNVLSSAITAIGANVNQRIFIYTSGATLTANIPLNAGGWLVGQAAVGASFDAVMGVTYPADTASRPAVNNLTRPFITRAVGSTVTLGNGSNVFGVSLGASGTGTALSGAVNAATVGNATTSDVTISNSGGSGAVNLGAGNGTVAINASIFNSGSASTGVTVASRTGGTVTFSRDISIISGTGVALSNNTGATINFTGGLALNTGANAAFTATGGGTVNATQNNTSIVNNATTTTATAVNLNSVSIGASGLTFHSVNTNGAANGMSFVSVTAGAPGFGIVGDGSGQANGTGGTITNATTEAVHMLTNNGTFAFNSMGFVMNTSATDGILVDNNAGSTITANFTGCTFAGVTASVLQNKSLLQYEAGGAANVTANVQNCFFNSSRTYGIFTTAAGTAIMNVTVNQCGFGTNVNSGAAVNQPGTAITNPPAFSLGVTNSSSALVDYTITNNTFWGADGNLGAIYAVTISGASTTASAHLNGSFNFNKIGKTGVTGSGAANNSAGLGLLPGTQGAFQASVIGNDIRQVNSLGINFLNSVSAGNTNATLKCKANTLAEPDTTGAPAFLRAIVVSSGNSGGANNPWIAEIGDTTGTVPANKNNISGAWQAGFFIRVTNNNNTAALTLPGLLPLTGATAAQVNAFVQGANTLLASSVGAALGTAGINGSNVPLPLLFAPGGVEKIAVLEMATDASLAAAREAGLAAEKSQTVPVVQIAAPAALSKVGTAAGVLTQAQLDAIVAEARARWEATGLTGEQVARLRSLKFAVTTLSNNHLGEAGMDAIRVDRNAGGNGWFADASAQSDALFGTAASATRRYTDPSGAPAGRVDLLTTLVHEMGHALGLEDTYRIEDRNDIMFGLLTKGERRFPAKGQAAGAMPFNGDITHYLSGGLNPITIGTLPAGKSVVITYDVQIETPILGGATQLSGQGTVHSTTASFTDVLTADPNASGATVTLLAVPPTVTGSVASIGANATSVIINGTGFDTTPANNTVAFTGAITGAGTVTAATGTQLTVSISGQVLGALNAVVTTGAGNSGAAVQVATVIPVVTSNIANLAANAPTMTINGFGFSATPANNAVTFNDSAVGSVTAATTTSLTVTFSTNPASAGSLTASVTTSSVSSGAAVQVATVTPVVTLSTATILNTATTVTINGLGFANANASNSVAFNLGATGNVTSSSPTSITVTFTAQPSVGNLTAVVTSNTVPSGAAVQVATVTNLGITPNTANLAQNATTLVIAGNGFSTTVANNTVTLSSGTATVTAATAAQLTCTLGGSLSLGVLNASIVVTGTGSTGPTQVATVVAAPTVTANTANRAINAPTITIAGTNFSTTAANDTVAFNLGAVGTVTAATTTQLTVTFSTQPTSTGPLTANVTVFGGASGAVQVATVVAAPTVTANTANRAINAPTITIAGTNFSTTAANDTVVFNLGAVGTVTAATATQLTVTFTTQPTSTGSLTANVTVFGGSSGAVQVATIVPAITYTVTTTGNVITVTDIGGNSDTLAVSEPSAGNIQFDVAGRTFTVDGGTPLVGGSGPLALTGVTAITANAAAGDDIINVGAFTVPMPSLTINGGTGNDTVNLNGSITFAANASLDLDLQNDDPTPGTDAVNVAASANLLTSGSGTITVRVSKSIALAAGSSLRTVNGGITLEANLQAGPTAGDFLGIILNGATVTSSGGGNISMTGRGGNGTGNTNVGIGIVNGGQTTSTGTGTITFNGTGGTGAGGFNHGISIQGANTLVTAPTAITLTGTASPLSTGSLNMGIWVGSGGKVSATGAGSIALTGTGGGGTGENYGVNLGNNAPAVTAVNGDITVTGTAGAGGLAATSYAVTLGFPGNPAESISSTGTGNLKVTADSVRIVPSASLNFGPNTVTFVPKTAGFAINVGTDDTAAQLGLTDAELDRITAGTVKIGDAVSGAITISAVISPANYKTLALGNNTSLAATGGFASLIGPTAADIQNINVTGTLGINATATLTVTATGGFVPVGGQSFQIITNDLTDAISGTFPGYSEGGSIPAFLGSAFTAKASYIGGTGNDFVLSTNRPPVPGVVSVERSPTLSVKLPVAQIIAAATDPDAGDTISLFSVANGTNGTAQIVGNFVLYTPTGNFGATHTFTYVIQDNHGAQATGSVTVTVKVDNAPAQNITKITLNGDGSVAIDFAGIPGFTYGLQYSPDLIVPWVNVGPVTANAVGAAHAVHNPPNVGSSGFYRLVYPAP